MKFVVKHDSGTYLAGNDYLPVWDSNINNAMQFDSEQKALDGIYKMRFYNVFINRLSILTL